MAEITDDAMERATGKRRAGWFELLDAMGGREMTHKEIARALEEQGRIAERWWCQTVTVEYERHIGRRAHGQRQAGDFSAAASRTFAAADLDAGLSAWQAVAEASEPFDGVGLADPPSTSATEKWRYWRARLDDGSRVVVTVSMRRPGTCTLGLAHEGLHDEESVERWKRFWKPLLKSVG